MGLCKCPKRKVTNLFCFEHRVNVCESCLVTNHESCVVQSYLSWLTDSDYDPNCLFCSELLSSKETIRLKCFHVFHWSCLDARANQLPNTTAPAGYKCPMCLDVIFPNLNQTSPVIEKLREKLATVNWARAGLGMDMLTGSGSSNYEHSHASTNQTPSLADSYHMHHHNPPQPAFSPVVHQNSASNHQKSSFSVNIDEQQQQEMDHPFETTNTFTARSKLSSDHNNSLSRNGGFSARIADTDDSADSKYTKRGAERKLRTRFNRLPRSVTRILIGVCFLALFYVGFSYMNAAKTNLSGNEQIAEDPMFDPHANPHIKIEPKLK